MSTSSGSKYSKPLTHISIISVMLGVCVMILSVSIVTGFQKEIRNKVIGFGSHIRIVPFASADSYELPPMSINQPFYPVTGNSHITQIQSYAYKAGVVNHHGKLHGMVFKGVGEDFNTDFFSKMMLSGEFPHLHRDKNVTDVAISKTISDKLGVGLGEKLRMYFVVGEQQRARAFNVSAIYETGLEEFDSKIVIGDIHQIQRINGWDNDQVGGFEVFIDDFSNLDEVTSFLYENIPYTMDVKNIKSLHPEIFDWLMLLDMNVLIILLIMILVSVTTMISTLLILIIERTPMIGLLKSLGMNDRSISRIFLYHASRIIIRGIVIGNVLALFLGSLQAHFAVIKLDRDSYFMDAVPINFSFWSIVLINIGTLLICYLMMMIPARIISRINPIDALRYE